MQRERSERSITASGWTISSIIRGTMNNRKRQRLSPEQKWQIYQECQEPGAKVGEILRKYGLYSSDLRRLRRIVEEGALDALRHNVPGKKKVTTVPKEDYHRVKEELEEKEKALAEMSVLFTSLKKKVNLE